MDDSTFFLATCGAAATLVGLLFVAVQFNIDVLQPGSRWQAVASSTFSIYATLFILPLFFLAPALDAPSRAAAGLFFVVLGIFRTINTWIPVWRSTLPRSLHRLWQTLWLLVGPLLVYGYLANNLFLLLRGVPAVELQTGIQVTLIGLFAIALRNSWNLLVEVAYERKQKETKVT